MSHHGKKPPQLTLDDNLSQIAIKSVQKAIQSFFTSIATPGPTQIRDTTETSSDVSGILGMVQDTVEATLILSFQKETLFELLEKVYGKKFNEVDNTIKQGVGELTNIIYAQLKKSLNDKGHTFKMSIPTVVIGSGHQVYNLHQGKSMSIPFALESGRRFFLEITLQQAP